MGLMVDDEGNVLRVQAPAPTVRRRPTRVDAVLYRCGAGDRVVAAAVGDDAPLCRDCGRPTAPVTGRVVP